MDDDNYVWFKERYSVCDFIKDMFHKMDARINVLEASEVVHKKLYNELVERYQDKINKLSLIEAIRSEMNDEEYLDFGHVEDYMRKIDKIVCNCN